jgi:hypothetical protein
MLTVQRKRRNRRRHQVATIASVVVKVTGMLCAVFSQGSMDLFGPQDEKGKKKLKNKVKKKVKKAHEDLDRDHRGPAVLGKVAEHLGGQGS